jgi:hypothetical protein
LTYGDYTYVINSGNTNTVTITGFNSSYSGPLTILSNIEGKTVTSIGGSVFYFFTGLTSVTIPNSVTSIGSYAFYHCSGLTSVTIPNSVISIGDYALDFCTSLTNITVGGSNSVYSSVDGVLFNKNQTTLIRCGGGKVGAYSIPNSVASVEGYAFAYCTSLTSVILPNSVTNMGSFMNCTRLMSVTIPNSVTSIGNYTFAYCTSLTNITIPNGVTWIGNAAFLDCTSLTDITIPNNVTFLGVSAFQNSLLLTNVTIGSNVSSINDSTFEQCNHLRSVTIGSSVGSIGINAFAGCSSLISVTIPSGVISIKDRAFRNCNSLGSIFFKGNAPSYGSESFSNCGPTSTVYRLPGATKWPQVPRSWAGLSTALWQPQMLGDGNFGVLTNQFGFNINWTSGMVVVVEACTNLVNPGWSPLKTNVLRGDVLYFSDSDWMNYPNRYYRICWTQ